ncbi:MAG: hypothetical protein KDK30_05065 [Leptospiraceae bacterium]|nr:hypothetical protein [Leptospiraceae bacterium]
MLLLIVPAILNIIVIVLTVLAVAVLVLIVHRLIVRPAMNVKADRDAPPPQVGDIREILIDEQERIRRLSIGQLDSDVKTRMAGVKEDQLILIFRKDRGLEEYEITVEPGSNIFYRPPHAKKIEPLKSNEKILSRELIGYNALFRVAASVKNNRPLQYLEYELSSKFVINNIGEEKMRFDLELTRIFPGMDENSRDKKGVFSFSRFKVDHDDAE